MPPSDSDQEKTEDPTPKRREEAREEGNVARSMDLSGALVLLAAVLYFQFWGGQMITDVMDRTKWIYSQMPYLRGDPGTLIAYMRDTTMFVFQLTIPLLIAVVVFGIAANVAQFGFLFVPSVMQFDLGKLNPIEGLKRIFSLKGLVRLVMSVGKVGIIAAVLWLTVDDELGLMLSLPGMEVREIARYMADITMVLAIRFVMALIVLSLLDFAYQKWQQEQDLKMTKKEVEEETKRMEGDPQIKERMKEIQQDMAQQRMMSEVPEAEVVVTNPTEYAIALSYEDHEMNAPKVVAKGKDQIAHNIRQVASENHVPVVERPPLARALFQTCDVGEEVPEDLYNAVAEVLAYVYKLQENPGFAAV